MVSVQKKSPPLLFGIGILIFAGLILVAGIVAYWFFSDQEGDLYPGAQAITIQRHGTLYPFVFYQEDKFFQTEDFTPLVYRWYQNRYGLYSSSNGQNNCVAMETRSSRMWIDKVIHVAVCDTGSARMINFQRTLTFRFR